MLFVALLGLTPICTLLAQQADTLSDEALIQMAIADGMDPVDIPGYIYFHRHGVHGPTQTDKEATSCFQPPSNGIPLFISNPGFETGNFTNWNGAIGDNTLSSGGPMQNIQTGIFNGAINPYITDMNARHSLMQAPGAGIDPNGNFPIIPWGYGTYVARLGNSYTQYQGQYIQQTWVVSPADSFFILSYAVVTTFGHHVIGEEAYFQIEILDANNTPIYSRHDEHGALPSTYDSTANDVYYLPWESDTFDLSAYLGQTLKIKFTTGGCIWSGHYCYAYIDCAPMVNVGIDEHSATTVQVFPNPSSNGIFSVVCDVATTQAIPVVYDMSGRIVNAICARNAGGWTIDVSQCETGTYFVQIPVVEGVKHCNLIRQ